MKKVITYEQRVLKSKTGKDRKGIISFRIEREIPEPEEQIECWRARLRTSLPPEDRIMSYIIDMEGAAKDIIKDAGLDPDDLDAIYTFEDGSYGNYGEAIAKRKKDREPEGYANDILLNARVLRIEIKKNNLFEALLALVRMETADTFLNLALNELEILIGHEVIESGKKATKFSEEEKEAWAKQARKLISRKADLYLKPDGRPNCSLIAMRIVQENKMDEKSHQSIQKHLLSQIKKENM